MQKKQPNRNSLEVELEILNECRERPIKSKIGRSTNLSHDQVTRRLDQLIKRGYVHAVAATEKRRTKFSEFDEQRTRYALTESGEKRRKNLEAVIEHTDPFLFKKEVRKGE